MDEGHPRVLGNGRVVLFARTEEGHIWQLRSGNYGKTWSTAYPTPLVHPDAPPMIEKRSDHQTIRLRVWGGNDGSLADHEFEIKDRHPGFSKTVFQFDPETKHWSAVGQMPYALVTTGLAVWDNQVVIAGGEDRPSHRSAHVMAGHISRGSR